MKKGRVYFVLMLLTASGIAIIIRLYFLQITSYSYYSGLAKRQHSFSKTILPKRGQIFFQDKNGEERLAAVDQNGYFIYLSPKDLPKEEAELEAIYSKLQIIFKKNKIKIEREKFFKLAVKNNDPFEILSRRVKSEAAKEIEELKIKGVGSAYDEWRFYPAGYSTSQVLGFVSYKDVKPAGQYGIEETYENVLRGKAGYLKGEGLLGKVASFGKRLFEPPQNGYDLVLTIEPKLQTFLEEKLEQLVKKWQAEMAGGIIINPLTGKILSMAAKPDFDPNSYQDSLSLEVFKNPAIQNRYEFGSIFKPLTIAAALDQKVINSNTIYSDKGYVKIGESKIENYDKKARGDANVQKILNESLNTGAVFIAQKMGGEKLYEYFKNYGLNNLSGIGLNTEIKGDLKNLENGGEIEYATASFGQGLSVTPIGLIRALSALSNGGYLIKPYLVEKIKKTGFPDENFTPDIKQLRNNAVLKKETSEEISRMLVKVVDEALLAGKLKIKNYTAGGKTGTAQMPKEDSRGYSDKFFHSIFIYTPAFEPKFLTLLYMKNPKKARYASETLSESIMEITKFALNYYEVPPDR